jgi:hypothetical protein
MKITATGGTIRISIVREDGLPLTRGQIMVGHLWQFFSRLAVASGFSFQTDCEPKTVEFK